MDYSFEATCYRTALLLGLVDARIVLGWAERIVEHDAAPPSACFEIVGTPPGDLSALRSALWPLAVEPEPRSVLESMFGALHADLTSGRRGLADTLTILRQMRSMLRLPADLYADLNAAFVTYAADTRTGAAIAQWLQRFAGADLTWRQ